MTNERLSGIEQPSGEHGPQYLQLINMYAPSWGYGGPVRMFFDYARWMGREFQVAVFTGNVHHDFKQILASSETIQGVRIHRNKLLFHRLTRKNHYLHSPLMCVRAAQRIRASRGPAIVHFSDLRGMVALYAMILKLLYPKRVILVHSAFGSLYSKRAVRRKIYDALFLKAFVRLVDLRLVQNEHERDAYEQICRIYGAEGLPQISLLPLHLDRVPGDPARFTESGKNLTAVRNVRRAYGVPEDALVFLFLGRLHPSKGILRMMDAYVEFSRSCLRKTVLLIVGRDDGFQAKVEEYIHRSGRPEIFRIVNNVYETRFDYYFLADIFLGFPTIYEETMLASIEAMACGTPVIVSREADIPFVEEEGAGRVIDFDVGAAAETMAAIVRDLASFQVNARSVVARHFSGVAASKKLCALFRMAISGNLSPEKIGEPQGYEPALLDQDSSIEHTS